MKFIFGYAGIPKIAYDKVYRERERIAGGNAQFVSETFSDQIKEYYKKGHANFFLKKFHAMLKKDSHNELNDTGFAIIYIAYDGSDDFARQFFPSILTIPVAWALEGATKLEQRNSMNELVRRLEHASNLARSAIPIIKKEITERDSKTPLLLPLRNFGSKSLGKVLAHLQTDLPEASDPSDILKRARIAFEHQHPLQSIGTQARRCFVDTRGVEFHPPGQARHAFARGLFDSHPLSCLLAGRRRLGAPYDRAFHYDCRKGSKPLKGSFHGCHTPQKSWTGNPHLNIAPNDFVRA